MRTIDELRHSIPQVGRLESIGASPKIRAPIVSLPTAMVTVDKGLDADYHAKGRPSKRQVTLIQHEHLATIASLARRPDGLPEMLRRNLVVRGIDLLALEEQRFWAGEALLEGTGPCAPYSRMEEALGPGGYNAIRGHGGITARVLQGGELHVGDTVRLYQQA